MLFRFILHHETLRPAGGLVETKPETIEAYHIPHVSPLHLPLGLPIY